MALNQQWDGTHLDSIALPYNVSERELSDLPRIVEGENMYVTAGGKLARRPGTSAVGTTSSFQKAERSWVLETLLNGSTSIFTVVSAKNAGTLKYELWYTQDIIGPWTKVTALRDCNSSDYPHEAVAARGKLFVKSFPSTGETLGSISLETTDGVTLVTRPWGLLGPTQPARIRGAVTTNTLAVTTTSATGVTINSTTGFPAAPFVIQMGYEQMNVTAVVGSSFTVTRGYNNTTPSIHSANSTVLWRNWSSSAHIVTVNQYWRYAYAFKSITGHISNRSPEETNPDLLPSRTGPFFDQCPQVTLRGHSDTTNVPTIVVYRSTDGGGTFYKLEEVTNPGASDFTYLDDSLVSSSISGDPQPDSVLNLSDPAPSLTSNSPPPTVLAPGVTGVGTPSRCTPIAYFQGRLWFAIGEYVFASANEELNSGVPEEAFPSGTFGMFFKYQSTVRNLAATPESLFVGTMTDLNRISGSSKETFSSEKVGAQQGMAYNQPGSIVSFGESIAYLGFDYRVMLANASGVRCVSDPLGTEILDHNLANTLTDIQIRYWASGDREWLIVSSHDVLTTTESRHWIMDVKRTKEKGDPFWFTPWSFPSCTTLVGPLLGTLAPGRYLAFGSYSATHFQFALLGETGIALIDDSGCAYTDVGNIATGNYANYSRTSLFRQPTGNHVNTLREPGMASVVHRFVIERTKFSEVTELDPVVTYYLDDTGLTPISATDEDVARREESQGYVTHEYHVNTVCQRFGFAVSQAASTSEFEIQDFDIVWQPESGV